ncbi:MAG: thioredoxin domain-containing protein, partial [Mycobacterium sp.]
MTTLDLTAEKFNETIESNDIVLVDFWASWCG